MWKIGQRAWQTRKAVGTRPNKWPAHIRCYSKDEAAKEIEKLRLWGFGLAFVAGAQASYITFGQRRLRGSLGGLRAPLTLIVFQFYFCNVINRMQP